MPADGPALLVMLDLKLLDESKNDSDLDSQIVQILINLELEEEEQKSFQQEAIALSGMFVAKNKSIISL